MRSLVTQIDVIFHLPGSNSIAINTELHMITRAFLRRWTISRHPKYPLPAAKLCSVKSLRFPNPRGIFKIHAATTSNPFQSASVSRHCASYISMPRT